MSGYAIKNAPKISQRDVQERSVQRLNKLRKQLDSLPRGESLRERVCIVTGVGSQKGIGRATAFSFAREGARHLYLLDFVEDNLPELKQAITSRYPDVKVTVQQGDAADESTIKALCELAIKEEGRLDVFFANAGVAAGETYANTTISQFSRVMRVNVESVFLAIKHGSAAMQVTSKEKPASEGSILMTASVAGIRSGAGGGDYSASKAAVISLAKTGAHQLGVYNIRVNSLSPGIIETGMTTATFEYAKQRGTAGSIGQLSPLARYGLAEEVANVAAFLASDLSSYITGQNVPVDGGFSALHPTRPGKLA